MITLKELEEAEKNGVKTLYAVFPNPQGGREIVKQSLETAKTALERSLALSLKQPEWTERWFLSREDAKEYIGR